MQRDSSGWRVDFLEVDKGCGNEEDFQNVSGGSEVSVVSGCT